MAREPDEKFFAWLDGELSGDEAAAVEAEVSREPDLQALAQSHRALGNTLRSAFDPIAAAPVPDALTAVEGHPGAEVIAFRPRPRHSWIKPWFAVAASLVVGLMVGRMTLATPEVQRSNDGLFAGASLERTLNTQLARDKGAGPQRVGVTFRDAKGAICRTFEDARSSGVACRDSGRWRLDALFSGTPAQNSDYRMAGTDPRLADVVGSMIAGQPLDGKEEAKAQANGWR